MPLERDINIAVNGPFWVEVVNRVRIALAKNAGCLQNGSHMLLSLLPLIAKQA